MKLFQSHKRVNAARINSCGFEADGSGWVQFTDTDGEEVQFDAPAGFVRPGANCEPGDYLVRYDGGYMSWSPAAVFLDGYTEVLGKAETWQERAVLELNELDVRVNGLRKALLAGAVTDPQSVALMQRQYKAMEEYHAALELRLRHTGVIDVETPLTVRETPAAVEVTVSAPAGKRAEVMHGSGERQSAFTVTERQSQSRVVSPGDRITVRVADISTVAPKRASV